MRQWLLPTTHERAGRLHLGALILVLTVAFVAGVLFTTGCCGGAARSSAATLYRRVIGLVALSAIPLVVGHLGLGRMVGGRPTSSLSVASSVVTWFWLAALPVTVLALAVAGPDDFGWTFYTPYSTSRRVSSWGIASIVAYGALALATLGAIRGWLSVRAWRRPLGVGVLIGVVASLAGTAVAIQATVAELAFDPFELFHDAVGSTSIPPWLQTSCWTALASILIGLDIVIFRSAREHKSAKPSLLLAVVAVGVGLVGLGLMFRGTSSDHTIHGASLNAAAFHSVGLAPWLATAAIALPVTRRRRAAAAAWTGALLASLGALGLVACEIAFAPPADANLIGNIGNPRVGTQAALVIIGAAAAIGLLTCSALALWLRSDPEPQDRRQDA